MGNFFSRQVEGLLSVKRFKASVGLSSVGLGEAEGES